MSLSMKRTISEILIATLLTMLMLTACAGSQSSSVSSEAEPAAPQQAEALHMLRFTAHLEGISTPIGYWGDGADTYYFFLPSGCTPDTVEVQTQNGITLRKKGEGESDRVSFSNGEVLSGIECDSVYLLGCRDENNYIYELPVVFMAGSNIHSVFITTDSGSIANVLDDKNYKEPGSILITDPAGALAYEGKLSHIKGRGNGSWWSFKKPFNLKLAEKADLLGMGTSREWALINQEKDFSCMRNKIAYDLAKDAGLAYSPDSVYVDVWIDGEYFGLYLLTDRIGISPASVDITSLEDATQAVNLEKLSSYPIETATMIRHYPSLPMELQYCKVPNDPENITGGYLLELDKFYWSEKTSRFSTESIWHYTLKSPEFASEAQVRYIHNFICDMEDAICGLGQRHYSEFLDVPSWASMSVLQELLVNGDFMGSSQYFYKDIDTEKGNSLLYAAPVWDMDQTLGAGDFPIPYNVLLMPSRSLYKYLAEDPAFMNEIKTAYREVYRPLIAECVDTEIDAYAALIGQSARMNFTRWQVVVPDDCTDPLAEGVREIKDYLKRRADLLDDLWIHEKDYHVVRVTRDVHLHVSGNFYLDYIIMGGQSLGELAPPPKVDGFVFEGWYYGKPDNQGEPDDPERPVTEDLYVSAKYSPAVP